MPLFSISARATPVGDLTICDLDIGRGVLFQIGPLIGRKVQMKNLEPIETLKICNNGRYREGGDFQ